MANSAENEKLYAQMLDAFCRSISNTFEQMVFSAAEVGSPNEKKDGLPTGCVSGTIGLTGTHDSSPNELRSKVSLIFSEEIAVSIFRSMMMMEADAPVEMAELRDVVGELTNMTAGGAKTILSDAGFKLALSLPTVAVGHDHYLNAPSGISFSKVVPVVFNGSTFYLEFSVS